MYGFKTWCKRHSDNIRRASGVSVVAWKGFKERRQQLIRASVLSFSLTAASLGIVGTKLFYPYHMVVGVGLYVISFIPFIYRIYLSIDTWREYRAYGLVSGFLKKERRRLFFAIFMLILVAVFLWLRPLDEHPFADMTDQEVIATVEDDLYRSITAMDYLETTGNNLLQILEEAESDLNGAENIQLAFAEFLTAVAYSESLTEINRYFSSIPYRLWPQRLTSFMVSYSLYVKKYEILNRLVLKVSDNDHQKTALNQYVEELGRDNIYNEMTARFLSVKTRVRLLGGQLYSKLFIGDGVQYGESIILLTNKAYGSYDYLAQNLDETLKRTPEVLSNNAEQKIFDTWFPVQKGVATAMGRTIISTRGNEGLIEEEHAKEMELSMLPGDVMLQRRNWHVSNVGIPGFWTHSALYTGSLEKMDGYFASEFPFADFASFEEYLESEFPEVYSDYRTDRDNPKAVIEAIEPGVVLQALTKSTNADFVVVLRPNLSKKDKMLALFKAFSSYQKPYDFDFDFDTRDAMVCSELVYDAYFEKLPEKNGLHFTPSTVSGRKMVSPLDFAQKFADEFGNDGAEFSFVYLLMSNEKTKQVKVGIVEEFIDSLTWSKFSFLQSGT